MFLTHTIAVSYIWIWFWSIFFCMRKTWYDKRRFLLELREFDQKNFTFFFSHKIFGNIINKTVGFPCLFDITFQIVCLYNHMFIWNTWLSPNSNNLKNTLMNTDSYIKMLTINFLYMYIQHQQIMNNIKHSMPQILKSSYNSVFFFFNSIKNATFYNYGRLL